MSRTRHPPRMDHVANVERHLDTVLDSTDHARHTATLVVCDDRALPLVTVTVTDLDPDASPSDCAEILRVILSRVQQAGLAAEALLLALTRPGGLRVGESDRTWFRALYRVCVSAGLTPIGVFVVGSQGLRGVQLDDVG